jgi:uncharacterized membrane protein YhaH (DUF805 family)
MGFSDAIGACFNKYAVFTGRSPRPEYWFWVLFTFVVTVVLHLLGAVLGVLATVLYTLFWVATIVPSIAVGVRRLHDIDRSGWWLLIGLVPVAGWIVLLVFACLPGTPGPNRFGAPPLPGQPQFGSMPA